MSNGSIIGRLMDNKMMKKFKLQTNFMRRTKKIKKLFNVCGQGPSVLPFCCHSDRFAPTQYGRYYKENINLPQLLLVSNPFKSLLCTVDNCWQSYKSVPCLFFQTSFLIASLYHIDINIANRTHGSEETNSLIRKYKNVLRCD